MSSKAKKIEEEVNKLRKDIEFSMATTLIGTIILSVGMINNVPIEKLKDYFVAMGKMKELPNTIKGLTDFVWRSFGKVENIPIRANLVLLTDKQNIRSPMVGLVHNGEVLPSLPNGMSFGIIGCAREKRDNVEVEWLYDTDGMDFIDVEAEEIE